MMGRRVGGRYTAAPGDWDIAAAERGDVLRTRVPPLCKTLLKDALALRTGLFVATDRVFEKVNRREI